MHYTTLLSLSLPLLTSTAALLPRADITTDQIQTISPASASCANAPSANECATAAQAAPQIAKSFEKYKITNKAEQAAVIALMAFESVDFRYNREQAGTPGKGTRNMQSPTYNSKYASSIPALSSQVSNAAGDPAKILDALLSDEEYDFGSGAWFLSTQCEESVRSALQSGSDAGWEGYISSCVGTDANEGRREYWARAKGALGV